MTRPRNINYDRDLARHAPGIEHTVRQGVNEYTLTCARCGETSVVFRERQVLPPEVIASKIAQSGWRLSNTKAICPKSHRKDPVVTTNKPTEVVVSLPSRDARAMRRETIEWLTEAFNPETGRYKDSISDATIAAETGLAVTAVAALREEFFGSIKLPPEALAIKAELEEIRADAERRTQEIKELTTSLASLNTRTAAALRKLEQWGV